MKHAYERYMGDSGWKFRKIEVLPKCKTTSEFNYTYEYQLVRRKVFGFIPWTYWLIKSDIFWFNAPTVEYYDCSCGNENE